MSDERSGAGHERIVGELRIDGAELQQVAHEAASEYRKYIALQSSGIGMAAIGTALNLVEGEGLSSFLMLGLLCAVSIGGLSVQRMSRRQRIAGIVQSQPTGSAVSYQLGLSGMAIESDAGSGSKSLAWTECSSFEESAHAFFLYTTSIVPEVVYKRAFREDALPGIRERLGANIKRRAAGRALVLALVMGVMVLGIAIGVVVRAAHH